MMIVKPRVLRSAIAAGPVLRTGVGGSVYVGPETTAQL